MVGGMQSTINYYRADRRQIGFIKFILEAYDNMAVVTTMDAHQAILKVTAAPGCETLIDGVLKSLFPECQITHLDSLPLPAGAHETFAQ